MKTEVGQVWTLDPRLTSLRLDSTVVIAAGRDSLGRRVVAVDTCGRMRWVRLEDLEATHVLRVEMAA